MPKTNDNALYYGDNLDILRRYLKDETVDLVYLDPPFKHNQDYNVLFEEKSGAAAAAQVKAFEDTWTWDQVAAESYRDAVVQGGDVAKAMKAFRLALGETDMLAYLAMMAPRLVELHRVLKPTGALYLHCDPTASHYLKALLDAVFGPEHFWNEVVWKRTSGHSDARRYGRVHDIILYYSKDKPKWNKTFQAYDEGYVRQYYRYADPDGRKFMSGDLSAAGLTGGGYEYEWKGVERVWRVPEATMERLDAESRIFYTRNGIPRIKRYLDESKGLPVQDVWTDVEALRSWHAEKLGYPTQKPEALLDRIMKANTNEGDVVLDPFCGCGTAVAVAHRLRRRWIGIDITHLAVAVIRHRLRRDFSGVSYCVVGEPVSLPDAEALAKEDPHQFQWWAVGRLGVNPMKQKGADRGIDGRLYFHEGASDTQEIIISVKAGNTNPSHVRDLRGVIEREGAAIGLLITLGQPTQPMRREAASAGHYTSPSGTHHPRIQLLTAADLLDGKGADYPRSRPLTVVPHPEPEQLVLPATTPEPTAAEEPLPKPKPQKTALPDLVEELLQQAGITAPPVRLEPILERLNIELSASEGMRGDARVQAMTDPSAGGPAYWMVYYDPARPPERRRFTIAHELGHVVLRTGTDRDLASSARGGGGRRERGREREMDRFASELLMPTQFIRAAVSEIGLDVESLCRLFQVSRATMEIRLRELRLT